MGEPARKKGTNPMGEWYSDEEYQKMVDADQASEARDPLRAARGIFIALLLSSALWSFLLFLYLTAKLLGWL